MAVQFCTAGTVGYSATLGSWLHRGRGHGHVPVFDASSSLWLRHVSGRLVLDASWSWMWLRPVHSLLSHGGCGRARVMVLLVVITLCRDMPSAVLSSGSNHGSSRLLMHGQVRV